MSWRKLSSSGGRRVGYGDSVESAKRNEAVDTASTIGAPLLSGRNDARRGGTWKTDPSAAWIGIPAGLVGDDGRVGDEVIVGGIGGFVVEVMGEICFAIDDGSNAAVTIRQRTV
jgi:hypothetical protein